MRVTRTAMWLLVGVFQISVAAASSFTVDPTLGWQSTGVTVQVGDRLQIGASGTVCFYGACTSTTERDANGCCPSEPDPCQCQSSPAPNYFLAPGLREYALVGMIGDGPAFNVGEQLELISPVSGTLSLAFNDSESPGGRADNSGSYAASIVVEVTDSLIFPSVTTKTCDGASSSQPVLAKLTKPAKGAVITFKTPNGFAYDSISTVGLITAAWDQVQAIPHTDSGYVIVRLNNTAGMRLPADTVTLFQILFSGERLCNIDNFIHWDTAQSAFPSRKSAFTDTLFATFYPNFDGSRDSTEVKGYKAGDLDNSGGVDISDLSAMIDFLYISFTPSCLQQACDVTHDGLQDISDLSALIDYLYISFSALKCPL